MKASLSSTHQFAKRFLTTEYNILWAAASLRYGAGPARLAKQKKARVS
jgi:hypothetical protein